MKVMILNSGLARRLQPLTNSTHKCLLKVKGKTILERQIESFLELGKNNFLITTGPFEKEIKEFLSEKFPNLKVIYVNNPKYDKTNYIYSMWLARNEINDDVILLHGDLVFQRSVAKKIIDAKQNSVIIDKYAEIPEKDFKGRIENNQIMEIGINVFGEDAFFLQPFYFWKKDDFKRWMKHIDKFVQEEQVNCYAENAFNEISDEIHLFPMEINNEFCMEIDTLEDLKKANEIAME